MHGFPKISYGWQPDVADFRDHVWNAQEDAREQLRTDSAVDLRDEGLDLLHYELNGVHATCAVSLLAMLDWQCRKRNGKPLRASASFLHQLTKRVEGYRGNGVSLRGSFRALKQFGSPPEELWPSDEVHFASQPISPELYGFAHKFRAYRYVRLDRWADTAPGHVVAMRQWLANGNPLALGFAVPHAMESCQQHVVPFDPIRGSTSGGAACVVMGFNDELKLPIAVAHRKISPHARKYGAFLIKTCWGKAWGQAGYGWLPYAYIESRFAQDVWGFAHPDWQ